MPMVRYQIRNEYGLSDPQLFDNRDDPEALLEGLAMAGLVGLLRQLGDLAEFAAEIFHDLHEEVMATASRGHGLTLRLHQLEAEFPSVENALFSQISLPNAMQNEGIQWHTNVQIDQNLITRGDMPRFVMDSYEECRGPPRLFTLDKFDVAGAGACLKRYSDPSFFKTELASSYSIESEDAPRERKPRKIKKKATRWKKGETLESLLISSSDSPPSPNDQSSGKAPIYRGVKLKSRRLRNSDNNARKIYHSHLHELIESQQKIILDDSGRQSNIKPESNGIGKLVSLPVSLETENELQNMHKVYPIQEQNEVSSGSEKIEIAFETASSRQTKEKTMTDSDDIASEHENFVDALNTIEIDTETDSENISKCDPVKSPQKETMHENLAPDCVGELVGTDKGLELNREIEFGEATEEFFDNDDLMDVSSTSSLHSDGVHQIDQVSISHGCNLTAELNVPADDSENKLGAAEKTSTVDETQSGFEVLVGLPAQLHGHQEQTNFHRNINTPVTDASPETPEIPIVEDYLGSHEEHEYLINNRSSSGLEELEEPCVNPIEVSQVELRNISEEILNLEEYLISTSKDGSISQDTFSHGGKEASSHAIAAKPLDVHNEEATQNFVEDKLEDPNDRIQHEHINKLEDVLNDHSDKFKDVLNGEVSLFSNKDRETVPGSISSIPAEEATDLSTNMTGSALEGLHQIRIQHNNDPTTSASDDYMDDDRSTSNQEVESSSSAPHSPINIPEETRIQGSYPKYHMDDFIKPDEGLLDLGNTQEETHRDESSHHCEAETQAKQFNESEDWPQYPDEDKSRVLSINNKPPEPQAQQFNESEDWPQYPDEDESRVLLINNKPADEYFHDDCQNNSASKLHEFSADDNVSLEVCTQNPFSNNIYVGVDGMHSNKSVTLPDKECEMWVGDLEVGENEETSHTADVLREPTDSPRERIFEPEFGTKTTSMSQKDAVLQTDVALGLDTSLNFEAGEHLLPEKETIMEPCYAGDMDHVHDAYEEKLLMQDRFAHTNVAATSAEVSKLLEEDLETKSLETFEGLKVNNELHVESSELNQEGNVKDIAPILLLVKNEILVEGCRNNGIESAESGVLTSPVVITDAFVDFPKLSGDDNAQDGVLTHLLLKNEVLVESLKNNEEDSADVPPSPVLNNKSVYESMGLNEEYNTDECNAEGGVRKYFVLENEVLVEALNISETDDAEGGESAYSAANNEIVVETSKEGNAEDGGPLPLVIRSEVPVEALKTDEKYSAEEEEICEAGVPVPFVDHVHELLHNKEQKKEKHEVSVESINEKEEESADTVLPTRSADHVHETLQEPTNLSCHEPDTSPSSTFQECHHESVGYDNLVFTTEGENITQSCAISLDNPLFDASPCENLSEESSECHSNKPVPCINLHNNQEKLQEDIITEILHNDSTSGTVDPNKSMIAGSFHSSSFVKDQKLPQEEFDFKPSNVLSGNKSTDGDLGNNTLVNVSVESKENELDISSVYSLASEHKPPPLPPLGWRMGGKLSKGISLPSSEHSSKPVDEANQKPSVQIRSMEAPPITNHDDSGRAEGEKLRVMSLSDLPPLSCQHEFMNHCSSSLTFPGANVPSMEYANGSSADVGLVVPEMRASQYAWPDAQHPFLPVSTWSTGPNLVHVNQPGYLISLEDNLWAQYGIGTTVEDDRLVRKHHSIRNMPRNPLMDAVAAHDRSTMRKVSELVKPDDKLNTDERNSLLEQIRNKSFSLKPVGAQKTTSVKVPQTNLKVAAIVEKANAIRQAFVGSDEEDGDSWSDA